MLGDHRKSLSMCDEMTDHVDLLAPADIERICEIYERNNMPDKAEALRKMTE